MAQLFIIALTAGAYVYMPHFQHIANADKYLYFLTPFSTQTSETKNAIYNFCYDYLYILYRESGIKI